MRGDTMTREAKLSQLQMNIIDKDEELDRSRTVRSDAESRALAAEDRANQVLAQSDHRRT